MSMVSVLFGVQGNLSLLEIGLFFPTRLKQMEGSGGVHCFVAIWLDLGILTFGGLGPTKTKQLLQRGGLAL